FAARGAPAAVTRMAVHEAHYAVGFAPHALAVDATPGAGIPHAAFGGDHLYYGREVEGAWQVEMVDGERGVGRDAALAVDPGGTVHIAYWDEVQGVLKVAWGHSGSWSFQTVGTTGGVSPRPSVALWSDGRMAVAYRTAEGLRVARLDAAGNLVADELRREGSVSGSSSLVTPDGHLHVVYVVEALLGSGIGSRGRLFHEEFDGTSWWVEAVTCFCPYDVDVTSAITPGLASDGSGGLAVAYAERVLGSSNPVDPFRTWLEPRVARKPAGAAEWQVEELPGSVGSGLGFGGEADGTLHLAVATGQGVSYGRYTPGSGWSWSTAVAGAVTDLSLAVNRAGLPQLLYKGADPGAASFREVWWSVRSVMGEWVARRVDGASADLGWNPSLTTDDQGRMVAAYYDREGRWLFQIANGRPISGAGPPWLWWEWSRLVSTVGPGSNALPALERGRPATAIDASGTLHLLYESVDWYSGGLIDVVTVDLRHAWRENPADPGSVWHDEVVATSSVLGPGLALAAVGDTLHAVYGDPWAGKLVHASKPPGGGWSFETVEEGVAPGGAIDLAVDGAGHLHASYYDAGGKDLHYATDRSGAWSSEVVAGAGDVGVENAIAVDPAGHASIAFYDADHGDLLVATNASGSWEVAAVETAGDVGRDLDIARGPDGFLRIGYYDATARQLKVASNELGVWTIRTFDSGGLPGEGGVAVHVDAGNHVHLLYREGASRDLYYATDARLCRDNGDCGASEYCDFLGSPCGSLGQCERRPVLCPPTGGGVCGCDGLTYTNACLAHMAGVSVAYGGACTNLCTTNDGCGPGGYCDKPVGQCGGTGTCAARPASCAPVTDPVCGCDGATYDNACEAARAGVAVDHPGPCPAPCSGNGDCPQGQYCDKPEGVCGGTGVCSDRPLRCGFLFDPVCGCDGATYDNPCWAAMAGVSVAQAGACPRACTTNADCGAEEYCATPAGACGGEGVCTQRPFLCKDPLSPVCGCDGATYDNACSAAQAGVSPATHGACRPCSEAADCDTGESCQRPFGACGEAGVCLPAPDACDPALKPVCGCDGATYANRCYAALGGTSVAASGHCDADGDGVPDDGDISGASGDRPCAAGATTGCDDNCV
ncbi:MAG: hypothetical protein D6739_08740, partial [Nitrospirae bacterium]